MTVSCAEGDTGFIYAGALPFERTTTDLGNMPPAPLKIMMNVANPDRAFDFGMLPNAGIGLARLEMIIASHIGVHPKALLDYDLQDAATKAKIDERIAGYAGPVEFYVDRLAEGIATITASVAPKPVIVRLSDFKSNEYANLIGGKRYEPHEENPMIGFRGASRYIDPSFRDAFALECRAVKRVREDMGLDNLWVMIPFVRTLDEGRKVIEVLRENGLVQGENGLKVIMMCELPSNALMADEFLEMFDGFSIGSNDMTQLTLGPGPGFGDRREPVRRTRSGGQEVAGDGDQGRARQGQVHRHLRPGAERPSGPGAVADGARHRIGVAQPGHGRGHLAGACTVQGMMAPAKTGVAAFEPVKWLHENLTDKALDLAMAALILLIGWWLARRVAGLVDAAMQRMEAEEILRSFLRNVVFAALMIVVVIAALQKVGVPTTSLLAMLGAAGLAIGLALKDSLSNIASGIMLIVQRPFKAGDAVQVGGVEGVVEQVRIFTTRMRTFQNEMIVMPNSEITTKPIVNLTYKPLRRADIAVGIGYDERVDRAREVLLAAAKANPSVLSQAACGRDRRRAWARAAWTWCCVRGSRPRPMRRPAAT